MKLNVPHCLETMGTLLHSFKILGRNAAGPADREVAPDWDFPEIFKAGVTDVHQSVCVNVTLQLSGRGMSIPFPRDPLFVGREDVQQQLCEAILQPPSAGPLLIHGLPGVGKDTLLSETIRLSKIAQCPEIVLAMWLQGSTNVTFCQQLVDKFRVHRPKVVSSTKSQEEALSAIREWLSSNKGWLMAIEDVTLECEGVWKYVPMGYGRVVITSQELLIDIPTERILKVLPFKTADSLKLLRKMRLFEQTPDQQESSVKFGNTGIFDKDWGEDKWKAACEETNGEVLYSALVAGEKNKGKKQRHRKMYSQLLGYYKLRTSGLKKFLEEDLGNLPLSIKLIGNLLRAGPQDVGKLMEEFGSAKESNPLLLSDAEARAHNPQNDRHYVGLVLSVCITVQRMLSSCGDDAFVGNMHQLVQRSLREQVLVPSLLSVTAVVADTPSANYGFAAIGEQGDSDDESPLVGPSGLVALFRRSNGINWVSLLMVQLMRVMTDTYQFSENERGDEAVMQRLRKWTPSVQSLVEVFARPWCPEQYCPTVFDICKELHSVLLQYYGNAKSALPYAKNLANFARSKLHGNESVEID
eukprot:IDg12970t1